MAEDNKSENIKMITGDPKKAIIKLSIPMMVSMLLIMLYNKILKFFPLRICFQSFHTKNFKLCCIDICIQLSIWISINIHRTASLPFLIIHTYVLWCIDFI